MDSPRRREWRHPAGAEAFWNEWWYFDFADADGSVGGCVRLGLFPNLGRSWFWGYLVRRGEPLVVVRHDEAALPRGDGLELREDGLWAALYCETPDEHWTVGMEAFGVGLDDPADAFRGEWGDRVPVAFDLEWEASTPAVDRGPAGYAQPCSVSGEVLVGAEAIDVTAWGRREHGWGPWPWWRHRWAAAAGRLADGTEFFATTAPGGAPGAGAGGDVAPRPRPAGYVVGAGAAAATPVNRFEPPPPAGPLGLPSGSPMVVGDLEVSVTAVLAAPVPVTGPDGTASRLGRALCAY
ncbi:MAG TPA: hypothetical protein VFO65_00585, partial [Acidimicrobiales bacterium]|nr:hypothetical protein [Acidimicrobiales bacterium]